MNRLYLTTACLLAGLWLGGCAESEHQVRKDAALIGIPPDLEQQIDSTIAFPALRAAPSEYVGRVVALGGIVIKSKLTKEQTEVEVLQLPTSDGTLETKQRMRSQGRFLAVRKEFLDPATLEPGTPVTIVGEVSGSTVRRLDETEYQYPVIEIKHLTDWSEELSNQTLQTAYGGGYPPYYWTPWYWGSPYGHWPYYSPFWGPYPPFFGTRPIAPPPPPPPPDQIPPQFRR
ncbi:MAG: Slp family lipoprotein [Nitrospiraceae bacterium]